MQGLYGSISCTGMQRVVAALQRQTALGPGSCLVDIGAGLGRQVSKPLLQAARWIRVYPVFCWQPAAHIAAFPMPNLRRQHTWPDWGFASQVRQPWTTLPCRPLLHAMVSTGLASSFGVEIDAIKCQKAAAFLQQTTAELARRGGPEAEALPLPPITCSPIEQVGPSPSSASERGDP